MHQYATREVSLAERERMAPQAKPPAGRRFGSSAPNYSKQNLGHPPLPPTHTHTV